MTRYDINTIWTGSYLDKLMLTSGQFTSTVRGSLTLTTLDSAPGACSDDRVDTYLNGGVADILYRLSGQFSLTVKTSLDVHLKDTAVSGISCVIDPEDDSTLGQLWSGNISDKLYYQSGDLSSIVKDSQVITSYETFVAGVASAYATNYLFCGKDFDKIYLGSGHFTSTIKSSVGILALDTTSTDVSWNWDDTFFVGNEHDKLFHLSSTFSTTVRSSLATVLETSPLGIDVTNRIGLKQETVTFEAGAYQFPSPIFECAILKQVTLRVAICRGRMFASATRRVTSGSITMSIDAAVQAIEFINDPVSRAAHTLWEGHEGTDAYLMMQRGQITTTVETSLFCAAIDRDPYDICTDGTDTFWSGNYYDRLYRSAGMFTSTVLDTYPVNITNLKLPVSWEGENTIFISEQTQIKLLSGGFSSVIKTSLDYSAVATNPSGVSAIGDDYEVMVSNHTSASPHPLCLIFSSGQFSTVVHFSWSVSTPHEYTDWPTGAMWTGDHMAFTGEPPGTSTPKCWIMSGRTSGVLRSSLLFTDILGYYYQTDGIATTDAESRLAAAINSEAWIECSASMIVQAGTSSANTLAVESHWPTFNFYGESALYLLSGQVTSTILHYEHNLYDYWDDGAWRDIFHQVCGVSWDGGNVTLTVITPFSQMTLVELEGLFTSVIVNSHDTAYLNQGWGVSCKYVDTAVADYGQNMLFLTSGRFTEVIKDSLDVSAWTSWLGGLCLDDSNTSFTNCLLGFTTPPELGKAFLASGQFTSVLKTSIITQKLNGLPDGPYDRSDDLTWDGNDTTWVSGDPGGDQLVTRVVGQFSSVLLESTNLGTLSIGVLWTQQTGLIGIDFTNATNRLDPAHGVINSFAAIIATATFEVVPIVWISNVEIYPVLGYATVSCSAFVSWTSVVGFVGPCLGQASVIVVAGVIYNPKLTYLGNATVEIVPIVYVRVVVSITGEATVDVLGLCNGEFGEALFTCSATINAVVYLVYDRRIAFMAGIATMVVEVRNITDITPGIGLDYSDPRYLSVRVDGALVDFTDPRFRMDSYECSYDQGKILRFTEITSGGYGNRTYAHELEVNAKIDFNELGLRKFFSGRIVQANHVGKNAAEEVQYVIDGYQRYASLVQVVDYDVGVVTEVMTSTIHTYSVIETTALVQAYQPNVITAVHSLFMTYSGSLTAFGIPNSLYLGGSEDEGDTVTEQLVLNSPFPLAVQQLLDFAGHFKLFFDDAIDMWRIVKIDDGDVLDLEAADDYVDSHNVVVSTKDRYTAVYIEPENPSSIERVEGRLEHVANRFDFISELEPAWSLSLQDTWTSERGSDPESPWWPVFRWWQHKYGSGVPLAAINKETAHTATIMYEDESEELQYVKAKVYGTPYLKTAKDPDNGTHIGSMMMGLVDMVESPQPLIQGGNPDECGDAYPINAPSLGIFSPIYQWLYDPATGANTTGEIAPDPVRWPPTGYDGTAYDLFGIERELRKKIPNKAVSVEVAQQIHKLYRDVVVSGDVPIVGDMLGEITELQKQVRVSHPTRITPFSNVDAICTAFTYTFGQQGVNILSLSNDVLGLVGSKA